MGLQACWDEGGLSQWRGPEMWLWFGGPPRSTNSTLLLFSSGRKFPMPLSLLLLVLWFCWASLSGSWKARARTPSMLSPMSR